MYTHYPICISPLDNNYFFISWKPTVTLCRYSSCRIYAYAKFEVENEGKKNGGKSYSIALEFDRWIMVGWLLRTCYFSRGARKKNNLLFYCFIQPPKAPKWQTSSLHEFFRYQWTNLTFIDFNIFLPSPKNEGWGRERMRKKKSLYILEIMLINSFWVSQ